MTDPQYLDAEAPEADAAEQAVDADQQEDDDIPSDDIEAPEWDAHEQARVVPGEDEYR